MRRKEQPAVPASTTTRRGLLDGAEPATPSQSRQRELQALALLAELALAGRVRLVAGFPDHTWAAFDGLEPAQGVALLRLLLGQSEAEYAVRAVWIARSVLHGVPSDKYGSTLYGVQSRYRAFLCAHVLVDDAEAVLREARGHADPRVRSAVDDPTWQLGQRLMDGKPYGGNGWGVLNGHGGCHGECRAARE
jgi:hypothetical protein